MALFLHHADCLDVLPTLASGSVDLVLTDPVYPEVARPYGRMSESEWHMMMDVVVPECRRILKPTGSAVFVLQPNQERVGRMRPWLFDFQAKWSREWNMPQDCYWWNTAALPQTRNDPNRLRASLKHCVWLGDPGCYRDSTSVRWAESDYSVIDRMAARCRVESDAGSRVNRNRGRMAVAATVNGGVTPFNVIPIPTSGKGQSRGLHSHGAVTPLALALWWIKYACPEGGTVCDPFSGVGTVGKAALLLGRSFVGIEREAVSHNTAVLLLGGKDQALLFDGVA